MLRNSHLSLSLSRVPSADGIVSGGATSPTNLPSTLPTPLVPALPSSDIDPEEQAKMQRMRKHVINEFVTTEKEYIRDLEILTNVFLFPIRATAVITPAEISSVFSNIEDVEPIHKEFYKKLQEKVEASEGQDVLVGDIFHRFFHYFKLYSIYAAAHDDSLALLEECKKRKDFAKFLEVCHTDTKCNGLFLNSFLIKPIQRLCKYPLLLRELGKCTPEDHPDSKSIQEAFEKVNAVVDFVNEAKRIAEEQTKMKAIEEKFGIKDLCRVDRRLRREGRVMRWIKGKPLEERYLFVFSDLMLVMKPQGRENEDAKMKFKMVASAPLNKAKIINIADLPEKNLHHAFEIQLDLWKVTICVGNEAEKIAWVKDVKNCIKEFQREIAFQMKKEKEGKGGSQISLSKSTDGISRKNVGKKR